MDTQVLPVRMATQVDLAQLVPLVNQARMDTQVPQAKMATQVALDPKVNHI